MVVKRTNKMIEKFLVFLFSTVSVLAQGCYPFVRKRPAVTTPYSVYNKPEPGYLPERESVRILYFQVPTPFLPRDSTVITCRYELHVNETLYAVKWYKDMGEFFRFVPAATPQLKYLKQPGVIVDLSKSDQHQVYLTNLSIISAGNYTCQISTDRPYYRCVQITRPLDILVAPTEGPSLSSSNKGKTSFAFGDNVSIICKSGIGRPAPNIDWYMNDKLVDMDPAEREVVTYSNKLEVARLLITVSLDRENFIEDEIVLRCLTSINQPKLSYSRGIVAVFRYNGNGSSISMYVHSFYSTGGSLNLVPPISSLYLFLYGVIILMFHKASQLN